MSDALQSKDYEKLGYEAWIELWCASGSSPSATQCPARWMPSGEDRDAFIRGWGRANKEMRNG